jgi:hypothetical protein
MSDYVINYWDEFANDYLCFNHAVAATIAGRHITPEVEDDERGDGSRPCRECRNNSTQPASGDPKCPS